MPTSIVKVYNGKRGQWEVRAKVVLGWDGFLNLGMSKTVYTDSNGVAEVNHASKGEATIYVNGKTVGKMKTPGSKTITV